MDDVTIMVNLTTADLNQLKTLKIGVNNMSVWLTIGDGAIYDQSNQPLRPRVNGVTSIPVSAYTPDITPPQLVNFVLDLDGSGILWLTFSETVDADTFNSTLVTLQNAHQRSNNPLTHFSLSSESRNFAYDLSMQRWSLSKSDLDKIKRLFLLATNVNNTFISILTGSIEDVFGNPVTGIRETDGLMADNVIPDTLPPTLTSYSLNLTTEELILTFSETVNASSLMITAYRLS